MPSFVEEVSDTVHPTWVGAEVDSWGIDHGTWSVLMHTFPDADIPVMQLSINADKPLDYHLELGARLAPPREQGGLIIGSGNVVHNLGGMNARLPDDGFDWAQRFDDQVKETMADDPTEVAALDRHRDFAVAVPAPDHYIPLLYLAGLAGAADRGADVLVDGYAYGSLSMAAYTLDLDCPGAGDGTEGAAALPDGVPSDGSNM